MTKNFLASGNTREQININDEDTFILQNRINENLPKNDKIIDSYNENVINNDKGYEQPLSSSTKRRLFKV